MKVNLKHRDDFLIVEVGTNSIIVRPGERFHGWKYKRLRKLGEGEHKLVTKAQKNAPKKPELVLQGGML